MKLAIMTNATLVAALAFAVPTAAQEAGPADTKLAAQSLSDGESLRAIAALKTELEAYPGDPALLINLGIAYAQAGFETEARESFEAAIESRRPVDLETANGSVMDSRRLAQRALSMLERGKFRPSRPDQLTMADQ